MIITRRSMRGAPSAAGAGWVWAKAVATPVRAMTPARRAAREKFEVIGWFPDPD
jgi:hypothetical protein